MRLTIDKALLDVYDDFLGGSITNMEIGRGWLNAGFTVSSAAPVAGHAGIITLTSPGTTTYARLGLFGANGAQDLVKQGDVSYFGMVVKPHSALTNMGVKMGLLTGSGVDTGEHGPNGTYFEFWSGTSANWQCVSKNGGDATITVTNIEYELAEYYVLECLKTVDGDFFFINGQQVANHSPSDTLTTAAVDFLLVVEETDAAAKVIYVDQAGLRITVADEPVDRTAVTQILTHPGLTTSETTRTDNR